MISDEQASTIELSTSAATEGLACAYHPLPNLLMLSADEILSFYRGCQLDSFTRALSALRRGALSISDEIPLLRRYLDSYPAPDFQKRLEVTAVESVFREMHDHVMSHPVWVHPFFVRAAAGDLTLRQLRVFAPHYFNQVKNTRQCVALALGRFHSFLGTGDGQLDTATSEMTQVILAGLLSDEYGTAVTDDHSNGLQSQPEISVDIGRLFSAVTHPALFRHFLDALGLSLKQYDVPMLHAVADNVLVQRILASDPAYDELEALASVGLGMEWGVPAFFSMLIAGITKMARKEGLVLSPDSMEIWSSHVRQDVQHAIAVMIATCMYVRDERDLKRITGATNVLMAFRYDMMSEIYEEVFESPCARIAEIKLDPKHFMSDRRIQSLLLTARSQVGSSSVRDYPGYRQRQTILPTFGAR